MKTAAAALGLRKAYRRKRVLRDVSFEVYAGEILGIVGENGCGKSTLLRIVAGVLAPDGGAVQAHVRLGYCDQEPQVFPDLTVAEHFAYFARAYGLPDREWTATRDGLLEHFGFTGHRAIRAADLSGGTRQKLHLALALLPHAGLLVLDEPYAAFDWDTYLRFWTYAAERRTAGDAVIIVSHFAHERDRFDRLLELREGVLQCV